jgi:hypothetical protein
MLTAEQKEYENYEIRDVGIYADGMTLPRICISSTR